MAGHHHDAQLIARCRYAVQFIDLLQTYLLLEKVLSVSQRFQSYLSFLKLWKHEKSSYTLFSDHITELFRLVNTG